MQKVRMTRQNTKLENLTSPCLLNISPLMTSSRLIIFLNIHFSVSRSSGVRRSRS